MKTLAISGANSFVGQHLIRLLLQDASLKLRLLCHSAGYSSEIGFSHVQYLKGDLLSPESLSCFVDKADVVITLAYLWGVTIEDNVSAVKNLFDVSVKNGVKRFIHCSTAVVVGRTKEIVVCESSSCFPRSEYEKSKYEIEKMLLSHSSDMCEVIILRPTAVFGFNGKNVLKIVNDIRYGNRLINYIKYYMYGYRKLNLVPVENVIGSIVFLFKCKHNIANEVFIVSGDDSVNNNYRYVADAVMKSIGISIPLFLKEELPPAILKFLLFCYGRSVVDPMITYSSEKLFNLGYVQAVSFEIALEEYIDCQLSGSM